MDGSPLCCWRRWDNIRLLLHFHGMQHVWQWLLDSVAPQLERRGKISWLRIAKKTMHMIDTGE